MNDLNSSNMDLSVEDELGGTSKPDAQNKMSPALPDKYKGKSVDDIIVMHQNAEKKIAEQGTELGAIRRLITQPIPEKTRTEPVVERKPVTVDALVNDPDKAILDAVNSSPVVKKLDETNQRLNALDESVAYGKFTESHSTWQTDIQDPAFLAWVAKNPARTYLAQLADQRNYNAANDLWNMWDEFKEASTNASTDTREKKLEAVKVIRQGGSEPKTTGTIYSSQKLMDLRHKAYSGLDRAAEERWKEIQPDLIQAYKENRVR